MHLLSGLSWRSNEHNTGTEEWGKALNSWQGAAVVPAKERSRREILPAEGLLPRGPPTLNAAAVQHKAQPYLPKSARRRPADSTKLSGGTAVERVPPLDVLMFAERQFRRPGKDLHGKQSHCVARSGVGGSFRAWPAATEAGMRIAQIAPLFESVPPRLYGGTERVVSYLTEELIRQGHQVTLFASGDSITSAELVVNNRQHHAVKFRRHPVSDYELRLTKDKTLMSQFDSLRLSQSVCTGIA